MTHHPAAPDVESALLPTPEQRRIIEAPDGPVVVIAGAGTGKTSVICERVRWLLETHGRRIAGTDAWIAAEPEERHGDPFAGPLAPEQVLVLTYNVKAAAELAERLDAVVGPTTRARMTVTNFHSFCQHVLGESAADAGLPSIPDVLDGPGQLLLLWDLRLELGLRYYGELAYKALVDFINRAKDELVTPEEVARFADAERDEYERRFGGRFADAEARLLAAGSLGPLRVVQKA
jgi:DNA helicase-2/ATP-dependent DNA helicase PcrA